MKRFINDRSRNKRSQTHSWFEFDDETDIQDGKGSTGNSFTLEELRNLFSFRDTSCDTHDLLDCPCDGDGILVDRDLLTDEVTTEDMGFTLASQLKDSKVAQSLWAWLMVEKA